MSLNESERHSREFMLKAVERLETGERASALAIALSLIPQSYIPLPAPVQCKITTLGLNCSAVVTPFDCCFGR